MLTLTFKDPRSHYLDEPISATWLMYATMAALLCLTMRMLFICAVASGDASTGYTSKSFTNTGILT